MFLLDTNILSELRKPRPHAAVVSWYFSVPLSMLAAPSVAFYEMQAGVEITRKQARQKAAEIDAWIDSIFRDIAMLSLDYEAARETARKWPDILKIRWKTP